MAGCLEPRDTDERWFTPDPLDPIEIWAELAPSWAKGDLDVWLRGVEYYADVEVGAYQLNSPHGHPGTQRSSIGPFERMNSFNLGPLDVGDEFAVGAIIKGPEAWVDYRIEAFRITEEGVERIGILPVTPAQVQWASHGNSTISLRVDAPPGTPVFGWLGSTESTELVPNHRQVVKAGPHGATFWFTIGGPPGDYEQSFRAVLDPTKFITYHHGRVAIHSDGTATATQLK
jgi:hypothetical protein